MRFRNVCFTDYKYMEVNFKELEKKLPSEIEYLVFQIERCPDTGRLHAQCYCEFDKAYSQPRVKEILGNETHFQRRRGSQAQAIEYCRKEETRIQGPWEFGVKKCQGERNDLTEVVDAVRKGGIQLAVELLPEMYIKFGRGIEKYDFMIHKPLAWVKKEVTLIVGPTDIGKSRYVREHNPSLYSLLGEWFDGYTGEDTLLIEDYNGHQYDRTWLLQLLDGYPMRLEVKHGSVWNHFTKIYITSNIAPHLWTCYCDAFVRRVTAVRVLVAPLAQVAPAASLYKSTEVLGNTKLAPQPILAPANKRVSFKE